MPRVINIPKPLNLYPLKRSFSVYALCLNKGEQGRSSHKHTHTPLQQAVWDLLGRAMIRASHLRQKSCQTYRSFSGNFSETLVCVQFNWELRIFSSYYCLKQGERDFWKYLVPTGRSRSVPEAQGSRTTDHSNCSRKKKETVVSTLWPDDREIVAKNNLLGTGNSSIL